MYQNLSSKDLYELEEALYEEFSEFNKGSLNLRKRIAEVERERSKRWKEVLKILEKDS